MNKKRFFKNEYELVLFRDSTLMIVAAVVSLLLQVISFFTTLDGAKAYFEATFSLAPLFFALAVQSVVYFLENGIRRRVTAAKVIALTLAVMCSSYFSFVGIYNNINPPESYLEQTYNTYSGQLTAALEQLEYGVETEANADVNKAVNGIISEYSSLTAERDTLNTLSEQIAAARAEDAYGMTAPRVSDYEKYEDYAAAYSAYIASLSQSGTAEQQSKIEALLNKYGISDSADITERTAEITARLSLISGTIGADSESAFFSQAELVRQRILGGDEQALAERVFALYNDLSGDTLIVPSGLSQEEISLDLPEYSEISGDEPAAAVRERLAAVITAACDELNAVGCGIDPEDFPFENIYTLPIYAVLSGSFGADAAVSLILALLVDVLSLLFAMIFVKQKSILTAADTRSASAMRESLFEQNVLTALQLGICAEGGSFSGGWDSTEITERLAGFMSCFRAADFAAEQGFSLIAERADLVGYEMLTAFLCQFGLAKSISAEDAELLTNGESNAPSLLLKTKFLLWVSEKFCSPEKLTEGDTEKAVTA